MCTLHSSVHAHTQTHYSTYMYVVIRTYVAYIHIQIHIPNIFAYTHRCIHLHMHEHGHVHIYIHAHAHVCICTRTQNAHTRTCIHEHTHTHTHTHTQHTHTHIHTQNTTQHTHTHTHKTQHNTHIPLLLIQSQQGSTQASWCFHQASTKILQFD